MSAPVQPIQTPIGIEAPIRAQWGRELMAVAVIAIVIVFGAAGRWERAFRGGV